MDADRGTARWSIAGAAHPQLSLRLLGLFAQQNRVPRSIAGESHEGDFRLVIVADDVSPHSAELIAEKMRAMVGVASVGLIT